MRVDIPEQVYSSSFAWRILASKRPSGSSNRVAHQFQTIFRQALAIKVSNEISCLLEKVMALWLTPRGGLCLCAFP